MLRPSFGLFSLSLPTLFLAASPLSARAEWPFPTCPACPTAPGQASPQTPTPDKSGYHLFKPVPKDQMREFSTDRPDKTESPYTVDAGHFQIEADIVTFVHDKSTETDAATGGSIETKNQAFNWGVLNLKAGLTNSTDFQFVIPAFISQTATAGTEETTTRGVGDITMRLKQNIFGNDGGPVAIGVMPFVTLTSGKAGLGTEKIEGGLIFPISASLPNDWGLGMMFQVNKAKNDADDAYHSELISSITFGHDIVGNLGGYTEFFSQTSNETGAAWVATFDVGLTYEVVPNVQLDIGLNTGLTDAADDLNPFVGVSARF